MIGSNFVSPNKTNDLMKTKLKNLTAKMFATVALLVTAAVVSPGANAQGTFRNKIYKGFNASFGTNSFRSGSNIKQINRDRVTVAGGQVGVTFGTDVVRYDVGLIGYYSSVSDVAGTVDLHTNSISAKFFPLNSFDLPPSLLQPYFTGGVSYDRYKFYGHYTATDEGKINYSVDVPYVGKITQAKAFVGAGFEFRILSNRDFVHFFTEAKYAYNLTNNSTRLELENTTLSNNIMINAGITFGCRR
jgi:hypothetical protein